MTVMPMPPARPRPKASDRLAAKAREAVEADEERDEVDAERAVRVEGRTGGPRVFRDKLEVAEGGEQRHAEGHQERQPDGSADEVRHLARQGVDARAENVADDEQQQQPRPHDPVQGGFGRVRRVVGSCIGV